MRSAKFGVFGILILGDIITSLNGKEVANGNDLYKILDQCNVGETVSSLQFFSCLFYRLLMKSICDPGTFFIHM